MKVQSSFLAATVAAVLLSTLGCSKVLSEATAGVGSQDTQSAAAPAEMVSRAALPDFTTLVETYGPAVVNVTVVGKAQTVDFPGSSPRSGDPLEEFFRRFGQPMPRGNQPPSHGQGSGFIVSQDGYILTNAHVVADADEVTVKTTDRREYTAKVIGSDERTDVALLEDRGEKPADRAHRRSFQV